MKTIKGLTEDEIVEKYKGLVYKLANKAYATKRDILDTGLMSFDDVLQIAYIGLYDAIKTYDESKGFTFMTYAWRCINNRISKDAFRLKVVNSYIKLGSFSLDATINDDGETSLLELTGEEDESIEDMELREIQVRLFNRLSAEDRNMLIMRNVEGRALQEIGDKYGLSKERVRQKIEYVSNQLKIQYMRECKKCG